MVWPTFPLKGNPEKDAAPTYFGISFGASCLYWKPTASSEEIEVCCDRAVRVGEGPPTVASVEDDIALAKRKAEEAPPKQQFMADSAELEDASPPTEPGMEQREA